MKETFRVHEEGLSSIAKNVVQTLSSGDKHMARLLHLRGDLGAGKTTFTKVLAGHLGIPQEEVQSPTFILKREYQATHPYFRKLIHIDAYRFLTKEEGKVLSLHEDMKDPYSLIVIEWPEKMNTKNPDMTILLSVIDDETRDVEIDM